MKAVLNKILSLFLGVILTAGLLSGCGGRKERETLTMSSCNGLITDEFLEAFHREYPEVNLEIYNYVGMNGSGYAQHILEQGELADIYVSTQSFSRQAQEKYLLNLSNYSFVNNYTTLLLDAQEINGGIYLLPTGYQLCGIYYNKTLLRENGWQVPESFEELVTLSEQIEAAGYRTMGNAMDLEGYPLNFFFNLGNTVYFGTPQGTQWKEDFPRGEARAVGNEGLKEAVEYYHQWIAHGFITPEHMGAAQFYEGECVFYLCLGLGQYRYTTGEGKEYEFGIMPWLSQDGSNNMLTRSISRYMGINKSLAERGNEQKLEDALKLFQFLSTREGQEALLAGRSEFMFSLDENAVPQDSPYREVMSLVQEGRTVELVYVGWEDYIIPVAWQLKRLIQGEVDTESLVEALDRVREEVAEGSSADLYASLERTLTMEETARLAAIAQGKAVGADCAIISLNAGRKGGLSNYYGLSWHLYQGDIKEDCVNMIRPRSSTVSVVERTGAEIKALQRGGFDWNKNGIPYEYCLFTKGDMELEDDIVYKLAVSTGELPEDWAETAAETEVSPGEAIIDYLKELGHIKDASSLVWD